MNPTTVLPPERLGPEARIVCLALRVDALDEVLEQMRRRLVDHHRRTGHDPRRLAHGVAELGSELADVRAWLDGFSGLGAVADQGSALRRSA